MKQRNEQADADECTLRLSLDAKATVKVGHFARGGKSRVPTKAADHDFEPAATVTPVGIFLPASDDLFLYGVTSKVGSRLSGGSPSRLVGDGQRALSSHNHPGHQSGQWPGEPQSAHGSLMHRLVEFAQRFHLTIRLAYYPPYHSKYNPIERCWGILEQHWNGALLNSLDEVIQYASTMTWKGQHPLVELVTTVYQTGVKLTKEAMNALETQLQRLPLLGKWFVDINSPLPAIRDG